MDWKHASMSGNLTWVKDTTSSSTRATLYSELSPTLIVGLTLHDCAPVDYVKFSTVTSVMHTAPRTVKLHLGDAAQLSLIAPDSRACLQWFGAINLALSGKKGGPGSVEKTPLRGEKQSLHEHSISTAGSGVAEVSARREPQRVPHTKDTNNISNVTNGIRDGASVPLKDDTVCIENADADRGVTVRQPHDASTHTLHSAPKSLYFAHSPQLSALHHGEPERTMLPHLTEDNAFLPSCQKRLTETSAVSGMTEPNVTRIGSAVDAFQEMRKGEAAFWGKVPQGEEHLSALGTCTCQLKQCSSTGDVSSAVLLSGVELRQPAVSLTSKDRDIMQQESPHTTDLSSPEPPRESLSFGVTGRELFESRLPVKAECSIRSEVGARDGLEELIHGDSAPCERYVDADSMSNAVRRGVIAPSSTELLSPRHAEPASFRQEAATRASQSYQLSQGNLTHADTDMTMWGKIGVEGGRRGVSGKDELVDDTRSCQVNELVTHPAWRLPGSARLPLDCQGLPEASVLDRPGGEYTYHGKRTKTSVSQRALAEPILDRIINVSPRSAPRENSSPVVLSSGIDTPSVRLPSWERDGYYRPIEAAVAVVPRESTSVVRDLLGRPSSMESGWPRNVTTRCSARDAFPTKQRPVGPSLPLTYMHLDRGNSPRTVKEYTHKSYAAMPSPAYRRSEEHNYYNAACLSSRGGARALRGESTSPCSRREVFQGVLSRDSGRASRRNKLRRKVKSEVPQPTAHFLMEPTLFKKHPIQGHGSSEHYVCMTEDGAYIVCIPAREFEARCAIRQRGLASLEEVMCVYGEGCRAMALGNIDHVSLGTEEEWMHVLELQAVGLDRLVCVVSRSHAFVLEAATAAGANNFVEAWNAFLFKYA
ncbi:hypothetical protein TraAM80_03087 [Trypanosoma rangeli]|uniref:PH domain-containing protein n=1 Tax=Trypanosoma rangeli TaxID=5698 RepID=A0A422NRD5_TRYRA|nr:uncharacterized protein TraAM80_03087 [Trypanosoma rangeli]RNF07939.1 hypothetical protein TraAM80_03087 [Trypanosoma rangeli]|eukprot:RNF07939.1 hypothetical protein TraAM80_03087 [Trypanosoma rangeli]